MKIILLPVTLLAILFCFVTPSIVNAQQKLLEVREEKVNPEDGLGFIAKRLGEKIKLIIYSPVSKKKEGLYKNIAEKRLAELKHVVDKSDMANFEKATTRYSTTIGDWSEYINKKNLTTQKQQAIDILNEQTPVIKTLMDKFDSNTAEWRFLKQDLDYANIYISQLGK